MQKRQYKAIIDEIGFSMELDGKELSPFVTHFGKFGDIRIYDQRKKECILDTKGVILNSFYPNMENRDMAHKQARHLSYLFEDYRYQMKLKYPRGRLRSIYKEMCDPLVNNMEDTVVVCERCLHKVYPSCLAQYDYHCFVDNEDLYVTETHEMDKEAYLDRMAEMIGCPRGKIEKLHCEYDAYVWNNYLRDGPVDFALTLQEFYEGREQTLKPSFAMEMKL